VAPEEAFGRLDERTRRPRPARPHVTAQSIRHLRFRHQPQGLRPVAPLRHVMREPWQNHPCHASHTENMPIPPNPLNRTSVMWPRNPVLAGGHAGERA